MRFHCPSCSASYKSEDYPNIFEINCVCGYAIMVPESKGGRGADGPIATSKMERENPPAFSSAVPTAMDAEDEAVLISPEGLDALNPKEEKAEAPESEGMLAMTTPDQLPPELLYDPFELPSSRKIPERATPENPPLESARADSLAPVPQGGHSKTSDLVSRAQLASMGNFLGASFDVRVSDLSLEQIERIVLKLKKIVSERPWLAAEIKKRNIAFEELSKNMELRNLPELLALEVYLATFEEGGLCEFGQSS